MISRVFGSIVRYGGEKISRRLTPYINTIAMPLYDNTHYRLVALASPPMAVRLAVRYQRLANSVVPIILDHVKNRFGPNVQVAFIVLLGGASSFKYFTDIDINVGLVGKRGQADRFKVLICDEHVGLKYKEIEAFYLNANDLTAADFRYIYSKPVLFGVVPDFADFDIDFFTELEKAARDCLCEFEKKVVARDQETLRKANHFLLAACRHIYKIRQISGATVPTDLLKVVREILFIDGYKDFSRDRMDRLYLTIKTWLSSYPLDH